MLPRLMWTVLDLLTKKRLLQIATVVAAVVADATAIATGLLLHTCSFLLLVLHFMSALYVCSARYM